MDYVTDEYEAECVEYDSDDEEKTCTEIPNTSWNENQEIENTSFEKNSPTSEERSIMIEELQKLFQERRELRLKNIYLQKKICNFLIKSKNLNAVEKIAIDCVSIHSDYRYKQVLDEYEAFEIKLNDISQENHHVTKQCEDLYEARIADFNLIFEELKSKLSEIRLKIKSHEHKETKDLISNWQNKLQKRLEVLTDIRTKYFKLEYIHKELKSLIKIQIELPKEYSLVDYENLKIMKNDNADTYDQIQKDLKNVREKLNSTIKVLGHVQQVLDVVTNELQMVEARLEELHNMKNEQLLELRKIKKLYYLQQKKLCEQRELQTVLTWITAGKSLNN